MEVDIKNAAFDKGYTKGFRDGRDDGENERKKLETVIDRLNYRVAALERAIQDAAGVL